VRDPEKREPISRLREALARSYLVERCFGGRRQVGKDHAQSKSDESDPTSSNQTPGALAAIIFPRTGCLWTAGTARQRRRAERILSYGHFPIRDSPHARIVHDLDSYGASPLGAIV
jgi:hypothetical protein